MARKSARLTPKHRMASARKVVSTAVLPFGGRLHKARLVWRLIAKNKFVLSVVDSGYRIR